MDNEREVDPADMTWPTWTEIAEVTGVSFTDTETGETFELEPTERSYVANSAGTFTAHWASDGLLHIEGLDS